MTSLSGLCHTPIELLCSIFEELSLAQLDALERAYAGHQLGRTINSYFLHRAVSSLANPLFDLVEIGRVEELQHLASHARFDINVRNRASQTPIHIAAQRGSLSVLRALFTFPGASVEAEDVSGSSALVLAARNGHPTVAKFLLRQDAQIDHPTHRGETAFSWAARNGHTDVVDLLISYKADLQRQDVEGWTALEWAVTGGWNNVTDVIFRHPSYAQGTQAQRNKLLLLAAESGNDWAIQLLSTAGIDVDCVDDQGSTPLHWAVAFDHQSTTALLLDLGADPNSRDNYDNTPLHWAIASAGITRLLLRKGGEANVQNRNRQTSLMWSVLAQQEASTRILLGQGGARVDIQDTNRCTALHGAAARGSLTMISLLIAEGADTRVVDLDGWMPIDVAVVNGHAAAVAMLEQKMNNGLAVAHSISEWPRDEDMRDALTEMALRKSTGSQGVTGLRSAVNGNHTHRVLVMLDAGVDIDELDPVCGATALTLAAWLNLESIARLLLDRGASVDVRDGDGRTALHIAVERGYCDLVLLLVERGANVQAKHCGWTSLMLAAKRLWDTEVGPWMVEYLSEKSATIDGEPRDYYGRGLLHWCAVYGEVRTITSLVRHGSLPDARDRCGQSALHLAIGAYRADNARAIIRQQGIDLAAKSVDGLTPAHIAAYTGQLNMLTLLSGHAADTCDLDLGARDVDGYTALTIAVLTGNLHVAQFLRRLPNGLEGDLHLESTETPYVDTLTWSPPPLQLPTEVESVELRHAGEVGCPQKPLFGDGVRKWLRRQRDLVQ